MQRLQLGYNHNQCGSSAASVKNGTRVTVHWPNSACSILATAEQRFLQMADTPNRRIVMRHLEDTGEIAVARWLARFTDETRPAPMAARWRTSRQRQPREPALPSLNSQRICHQEHEQMRWTVVSAASLNSAS